MEPNWAQILSSGAAVIAVVVASFAWRNSVRTYQAAYRPVLRPVVMRHPNGDIASELLVLKNIGRGPAVSVFLVEPNPPAGERWPLTHPGPVVATVDVVEPLGAPTGGGEVTRVGRVKLPIPIARLLRRNTEYRLVYQDLLTRWHETTFSIDDEQRTSTRHLGALGWFAKEYLPPEVLTRAQIVFDNE